MMKRKQSPRRTRSDATNNNPFSGARQRQYFGPQSNYLQGSWKWKDYPDRVPALVNTLLMNRERHQRHAKHDEWKQVLKLLNKDLPQSRNLRAMFDVHKNKSQTKSIPSRVSAKGFTAKKKLKNKQIRNFYGQEFVNAPAPNQMKLLRQLNKSAGGWRHK